MRAGVIIAVWTIVVLLVPTSEALLAFSTTQVLPANDRTSLLLSSSSKESVDPPSSADEDDFYRSFRRNVSPKVHYFLRDSGLLRFLVDGLAYAVAIPAVLREKRCALPRFLHLSGSPLWLRKLACRILRYEPDDPDVPMQSQVEFRRLLYGAKTRRQNVQLMRLATPEPVKTAKHLILFVHGGAWGSGFPLMYRLVAGPFLNNKDTQVGIIGYRTFPDATVDEQIADVADCLLMLKETGIQGPTTTTSLIGHSSGAHIASMAILSEDLCDYRFDHFIALSGVFDIPRHYEFERKRGVERFSPMAAACTTRNKSGSPAVTLRDWKLRSPTRLLRAQQASLKRFPPCLVCHGALDTTVPVESAIHFAEALTNATEQTSTNVELVILPTGHSEVVEDLMFGGPTRDTVLKWMNNETP